MVRRDFLKNSALVAATAALYSPLSAASSDDSTEKKIIAIVSESAHETGYISALEKGDKADEVIILGSDRLSTMHTLASAIENNKGSLFCGLLAPSDHDTVATAKQTDFVSEHTAKNAFVSFVLKA